MFPASSASGIGVRMATSPIYVEPTPPSAIRTHVTESRDDYSNRLQRLEGEVTDLRDTIARFADLMIGEMKDLRKAHQDLPLVPPSLAGELPSDPNDQYTAESSPGTPSPPMEPNQRRPWLLMDLLRDLGSSFRMYLDPRYRVRRATQLMVPLILALFALNCFVFNTMFTMAFISSILEKFFDIILAVLLYQVIHREVARYRSIISQLTAWQSYRARTILVNAEPGMTTLETE